MFRNLKHLSWEGVRELDLFGLEKSWLKGKPNSNLPVLMRNLLKTGAWPLLVV